MKELIIFVGLIIPYIVVGQKPEMLKTDSLIKNETLSDVPTIKTTAVSATTTAVVPKAEVFNSGFIDFQNSGQMNASARIFRIYIGEPKKIYFPLSVYSGVSGNNYNSGSTLRGSEPLALGLINPTSGAFNILSDNNFSLSGKKKLSQASIVFQLGEKLLIAQQATTFRSFSFFSTYSNLGLLLQTGAWEKNNEKNMGMFWLLLRYHYISIGSSFRKVSGYPPDKSNFSGFSIGLGIEINSVLNIKSYYYRYINPGDDVFNFPMYQLTFNYSMKPA